MSEARPPLELLAIVASRLQGARFPVVYVGGAATCLLITDEAAPPPRATTDVDVIVEIDAYGVYATRIVPELRRLGAVEDTREDAPLCRWILGGVAVDVMPTDAGVLGFSNRWYAAAPDLQAHVADWMNDTLSNDSFLDVIAGHLPGDIDNYARAEIVRDRARRLADLGT